MKIIVMGCGRVGEQVSRLMADEGHDVVVIDRDPNALARLGLEFKGRKVIGVGFDRKVMIDAGIEHADAFAAASNSDNANIVAARIARQQSAATAYPPRPPRSLSRPQRTQSRR